MLAAQLALPVCYLGVSSYRDICHNPLMEEITPDRLVVLTTACVCVVYMG